MKKSANESILNPLERKQSLSNLTYEALYEAIISGQLEPGARIKERDIAAHLNISRTPVKEAMRRLEQVGLVRQGVVAEKISLEEIYLIRATLHGLSARLAADKITPEQLTDIQENIRQTEKIIDQGSAKKIYELFRRFHILVFTAAKNVYMYKFQMSIGSFIREVRLQAVADRSQARKGLAAHKKIAQALEKKDADTAEDVMRSHILKSARFVLGDHPLLETAKKGK